MRTAVVLGASGSLATTVERLNRDGWLVTAASRRVTGVPMDWVERGVQVVAVDRGDVEAVRRLVGNGVDLLVDGQCYTPQHGRDLAVWSASCASTVMLSARAVYVDSDGRHSNSEVPPRWSGPTNEAQPTMEFHGEYYDSREGYGANKAESERILQANGTRVSILRPGKVHGRYVRRVREWPLVQRVLDGIDWLPVRDGDRVESTTSTSVLADAVIACAHAPATRLLNVADDDPQPARRLAAAVVQAAGAQLRQVEVDERCPPQVGRLPWTLNHVMDTGMLRALGVRPPTFANTIGAEVAWLVSVATRLGSREWRLPEWLDASMPDYSAERACQPDCDA